MGHGTTRWAGAYSALSCTVLLHAYHLLDIVLHSWFMGLSKEQSEDELVLTSFSPNIR
jgi:hypothetical protein